MRFRVLGAVAYSTGAAWVQPAGPLRRRLLAVLLARAGQHVPLEVLTEALWGSDQVDRVQQRLHVHVHRLRADLGEPSLLISAGGGYELRIAAEHVDAGAFEDLARAAQESEDEAHRAERARQALQQWSGGWSAQAYEGIDVPLCRDEADRLATLRVVTAETYFAAEVHRGRHLDVLTELTRLAQLHPLRESLQGLLMRALHQAGRRQDALEVYRRTRRCLVQELGLEPSDALAAAQGLVLTGSAVPDVRPVPAQLPAAGAVVGRSGEAAALSELLVPSERAPRIGVLCGAPGVGKSALAVRWAREHRDAFPDGQLFVDLQGYSPGSPVPPERVLNGFIRALGGDPAGLHDLDERSATFRSLVADRRVLVVLDNARDVEQVRPLLPGAADSRVVITSRDGLGGLSLREDALRIELSGLEEEAAINLLQAPSTATAAAAMTADDDLWRELARRCAYVPLMLKIAGERVREDPGILASLTMPHVDGTTLDLWDLGDPASSAREVFSWSLRALPGAAVSAFSAIALAESNAVDIDAVAALEDVSVRAARRAVAALARAHLVSTDGRWVRLHDLVGAYAGERAESISAAAREAARTRSVARYAALVREAIMVLEEGRGSELFADPEAARAWLLAALGPVMSAIEHAPPQADDSVILISRSVPLLLVRSGNHEIGRVLHAAGLQAAERIGDRGAMASALSALGSIAARTGDHQSAQQHLDAAMTCAEESQDPIKMAVACNSYGIYLERTGALAAAVEYHRRSARCCERAGDKARHGLAVGNMAFVMARAGRLAEAEPLLVAQVDELLSARAEHLGRLPQALGSLAWLRMLQGRPDDAIAEAGRGLTAAAEIGADADEAELDWVIGMSLIQQRDDDGARAALTRSLGKARRFDDNDQIVRSLIGLAAVTEPDAARRLLDDAIARSRRVGMRANEADALIARARLLRECGEATEAEADHLRAQALLAQCGLAAPAPST